MTRYLKALGLATVAAFAFSALSAASASAQTPGQITSESTEVTLVGEHGEGGNTLTMFGSEIQCPDAIYTGHKVEATPQQPLHSGDTEVTITPHYNTGSGCDTGADSRTIDMNGCDYEFYDFTTTGEDPATYDLKTDIVCEGSDEITMTGGTCVVHFPPQEDLTGLHATNEGGKLRLSGEVTGITASLPCFGSHTPNAVWHTDIVVEGVDPVTEESTGIATSEASTQIAFSALSEAGNSAQGQLTSEATEATLFGQEDPQGTNALTMFGAEAQCPEAIYTGHELEATPHQSLHSGATAITVTPHYNAGEGCNDGGTGSRTIDMNGCDYAFDDFTTASETEGTFEFRTDIVCEGSDEITVTGGACVVHVPAQEGLTGLHTTNEAGGRVRMSGAVEGITARLPCLGSHTANGIWHTDILVEGFGE